jgi:uncharacterized protein DUF2752
VVTVHVALVRASAEARLRNALTLGGLLLWLTYTRFFWPLKSMHTTLPACPFLTITGHPCPFCGGTRSFAYMWDGHVDRAALLYPLGPLLFAGTLVAVPVLAIALLWGRDLEVRVPDQLRRAAFGAGLGVLAVSWALKLTVLPN